MPQAQVAKAMGIKQPTIASLEKNGKDVKLLPLKRYVEALGSQLRIYIKMPDGHHFGMKVSPSALNENGSEWISQWLLLLASD